MTEMFEVKKWTDGEEDYYTVVAFDSRGEEWDLNAEGGEIKTKKLLREFIHTLKQQQIINKTTKYKLLEEV